MREKCVRVSYAQAFIEQVKADRKPKTLKARKSLSGLPRNFLYCAARPKNLRITALTKHGNKQKHLSLMFNIANIFTQTFSKWKLSGIKKKHFHLKTNVEMFFFITYVFKMFFFSFIIDNICGLFQGSLSSQLIQSSLITLKTQRNFMRNQQ